MNSNARSVKWFTAFILAVAFTFPLGSSADVDVANARIDRIGLFDPDDTKGAMLQLTHLAASPAWSGSRQFFLSQESHGSVRSCWRLTSLNGFASFLEKVE